MNNILIRQALESDLQAVLSMYAQPLMDDGKVLACEQALEIFKKMQRYPDYRLYVAQSDSIAVGTFTLLIMDNLGHMGTPSGVIEDVVVHPQWQGKGIGTQMMQFAFEICRDSGCYKVALSSNIKRKNAHRFYESLGFEHHGYSFLVDLTRS
jgi:GNAT superfamily N-acetyltransferase